MDARTPPSLARRRALLELDGDLAEAIAPEQRAYARRALTVPIVLLGRGPWDAATCERVASGAFAVMFASGVAIREVLIGPEPSSELLGPGDIVEVGATQERMLPAGVRFYIAEPVTAAVLDERILAAIRAWPALAAALIARMARQGARQATHRAIAQLPRVDQRVVALMWHLAERWGRMTPAGVSVPLGLTHETIGRLVGARRPTVSLALKQLAASGAITRREDGAWLLEDDSARALAPDGPAPRRPEVALLAAADRPRPAVLPAAETLERLRVRMRLLEHAYSMYSQHTVDLLERCRQTRLAVADSRGERAANGGRPLTRPR